MIRPPKDLKQVCTFLSFPMHMSNERVRLYAEEAAKKLADIIYREIRDNAEPNWFVNNDGWRDGHYLVHEPGVYRLNVVFKVEKKLERFP